MAGFIAVHVGAGYHAENLRTSYKKTCKRACSTAINLLIEGAHAVEAVSEAVVVLEDCPLTNAGIGSNLTLSGMVECDASVMDGTSLNYSSVGSLSNMKNPIRVARKILEEQKKGLSFSRVPPCSLVGQGAIDWALEHGFQFYSASQMTTRVSEKAYLKNSQLLQKYESEFPNPTLKPCGSVVSQNPSISLNHSLLDTVGAVCVDSWGNVSSAVSSGGLLLKHSGRIGQAAVYGSGCWAQNSTEAEMPSVACSVTGVGEYLIKTLFAKEWHSKLLSTRNCVSSLPDIFRKQLLESPFLVSAKAPKLAGVLTVKHFAVDNFCELSWVHNTKTMMIGYGSTGKEKPVSVLSMQPEGSEQSVVGSERCVRWSKAVVE